MKYSDNELLQVLRDQHKLTGESPAYGSIQNIHVRVFTNRFGSWANALQLAGLPKRNRNKLPRFTKICQYSDCGKEFITSRDGQECCSTACANKRRRVHPKRIQKSREEWKRGLEIKSQQFMLETPFNELSWDIKRKRVIHEQQNKCNNCNLDTWIGVPLALEIDHKNGDHTDDDRNNLEGLCPNCHSLTPTWRGKNKACIKVDDDELLIALQTHKNVRQALLSVGMAAKGANYRRAKRLLSGIGKYGQMSDVNKQNVNNGAVV